MASSSGQGCLFPVLASGLPSRSSAALTLFLIFKPGQLDRVVAALDLGRRVFEAWVPCQKPTSLLTL